MISYPLRQVPDEVWHGAKIRATIDGVAVRDVIVLILQAYGARGLEAIGGRTPRPAPAAGGKTLTAYPLQNVDDTIWQAAKTQSVTDNVTIRQVIILGLERYVARGLEAFGGTPARQAPAALRKGGRR
ncbi:MAG TPA: hypothetical protein VKE96_12510 [Vicinamibacterales bacterium]|nr:hypothetical protein [Vicinamibacterales bacterium]